MVYNIYPTGGGDPGAQGKAVEKPVVAGVVEAADVAVEVVEAGPEGREAADK